jgi:hypothetical protein
MSLINQGICNYFSVEVPEAAKVYPHPLAVFGM